MDRKNRVCVGNSLALLLRFPPGMDKVVLKVYQNDGLGWAGESHVFPLLSIGFKILNMPCSARGSASTLPLLLCHASS